MFKNEMTRTERVRNTLLGKPTDRQPIYGWVYGNLTYEIDNMFGSLREFEEKYEYDMAHIFSGPEPLIGEVINQIRNENDGQLEPGYLLGRDDIFLPVDDVSLYDRVKADVKYFKGLGERFCYVQTPGILEYFNGIFGIQNHLLYLALYPDELMELYRKLTDWTKKYVCHCIDCGVDMVHISDDWGAQNSLLISPKMWWEMIYPYIKETVSTIHDNDCFASLHSDGCIKSVLDGVADIGFDLIHPYQENADMSYDIYLEKYSDKFAIMGGINVQNALGIMERDELEADIRRIFSLLRGKRWVVCTTHFVQKHCKVEDLKFAYDLIYELVRA